MPHTYPLMLDVADRLIVIVGGGAVAVRKAKTLIECGATRVRCVSPEIEEAMPEGVERITRRYEVKDLDGAGLVFAATNVPAINATVVNDARLRNVLVNRADADESDPGDFSTPARWTDSSVTVTVSAGGSPALAATIRDGIRNHWDPRWSRMADAMQMIRPMIVARVELSQKRRGEMFRALATIDAMDVLSSGGPAALTAWLAERFPEMQNA